MSGMGAGGISAAFRGRLTALWAIWLANGAAAHADEVVSFPSLDRALTRCVADVYIEQHNARFAVAARTALRSLDRTVSCPGNRWLPMSAEWSNALRLSKGRSGARS